MENLELWNKVCRPPEDALTKITGGRLSGMTDISPQWRIKIMTEQFGPVGTGWGYDIERLWIEDGSDGQKCAFAQISLWYEGCKKPVPGVGGSMLITNESKGPYTSDEAFKMAITDAVSVALKQLGVAADIYFGMWDGSKYLTPPADTTDPEAQKLYKECVSLLGDAKLDGRVSQKAYDAAIQRLHSDYVTTVPSMTAALESLKKTLAPKPENPDVTSDNEPDTPDETEDGGLF